MDPRDATVVVFEECWNRANFGPISTIMADRFRFHVGAVTRTMTLAELETLVSRWREGFPDLRFDVHAVVASGGRSAVHSTLTGTHEGRWNDLEPTGRSISVEHMFFFRFEAGRIVEVWELLDRDAFRAQLSSDADGAPTTR